MTRHPARLVPLLAALVASAAAAQAPTTSPMGQTLLRRIAEAVDGDRSGRLVWVVASRQAPNGVAGVAHDSAAAATLARETGPAFAAFGPYLSETEVPQPTAAAAATSVTCVHMSTSATFCPDTTNVRRRSTTIVYTMMDGSRREIPLDPRVDAVFLTTSAMEKFVFPYYAHVLGVVRAAALHKELLGRH